MEENEQAPEEHQYAIRKNKSQIKRDMSVLRDLGKRMRALSDAKLNTMPIANQLKQEIIKGRNFKKEALRRHLIFLEKLMRIEDAEAVVVALDRLDKPHLDDVNQFHEVEQWRDRLIAGDYALIEELNTRFDGFDRQHIRQLIRNATKEKTENKPSKSFRLLFRYLKGFQ